MLRIAFDARHLAAPVLRGMDRYTVGLVAALAERGVEVTLLHRTSQPPFAAHLAELRCKVKAVPGREGVYWEQVALPMELLRGRYHVYHAPAERGVPFASPCPVVLTYHSATAHSYDALTRRGLLPGKVGAYLGPTVPRTPTSGWRGRYLALQAARADHVLTPSRFGRRELINLVRLPPKKVSVTPLAVAGQFHGPPKCERDRADTLERLGVRSPYVLYVGGYELHKNPAGVLEAFALVLRARPNLALVMVGSTPPSPGVVRRSTELGLQPGRQVHFLWGLDRELVDLYDGAGLFVSLSWRETFCLPALEAMTRGTPVVASRWGAGPETVQGGGILVDPRSPASAAAAVCAALVPAERTRLSSLARRAAEAFSWDRTAELTLAAYRRLVA